MIIHFNKVHETGIWIAHEQDVAFFHDTLCTKIKNYLKENVEGLIFCPNVQAGFIYFVFETVGDEAFFLLLSSDGLEIP